MRGREFRDDEFNISHSLRQIYLFRQRCHATCLHARDDTIIKY